jgi:hypothetical protein
VADHDRVVALGKLLGGEGRPEVPVRGFQPLEGGSDPLGGQSIIRSSPALFEASARGPSRR